MPEDMIPRNNMLETIKRTFERFGFAPMDTPGLERAEVLGKEGSDFLIYRAGLEGSQDMALRYDLTVPLARVVAANPDLPRPFKRYQFGRVWRGEKQQTGKGRWREFTQLDIDIVGSNSSQADAEIVAVMYETLNALGLTGNFIIKLNNRKILAGLSDEVLRTIDKLDKVGRDGVEKELVEKFTPDEAEKAKRLFAGEPVINDELQALIDNAKLLDVPESALRVDNTVVRGLGYYTGNIFEAVLLNSDTDFGSIISGGRYDNLVERFAPYSVPAVGASVGVDRLFSALDQLDLVKRQKTTAKVLVLNFDESCRDEVQKAASQLRRAEVPTELYLGQEDSFKGQLAYAVKREYPIVIILGADEKSKGVVQIKNMSARTQTEVSQDNLTSSVKEILK